MNSCLSWKLKTLAGVLAALLTIFLTFDFVPIQICVTIGYGLPDPKLNKNVAIWKRMENAAVMSTEDESGLESNPFRKMARSRNRKLEAERERRKGEFNLARIDLIQAANNEELPGRMITGSADELCAATQAANATPVCIPKFLTLETRARVAPEYKLLTCIIQKNMSTMMTAIFCYLFDQEKFIAARREFAKECIPIRQVSIKMPKFCQGKNEFNSTMNARERYGISNETDNDWAFTMITRNPIDRFLSGFVDKCIRFPRSPCNGCGRNLTCFVVTEYNRMLQQLQRDRPSQSYEDRHFFPQNWRCDLATEYANYKFIRYSSDPSSTLLEDLVPVLEKQNVPAASIDHIRSELSKGRTMHSTVQSDARTFYEKRLRSSPFLMEYIVRMFYHDFKLFNYSLPDGF